MNCTDFLAKLTDYFDGQIEAELLDEVKQHLSSCHHCEVIVDTTRRTIDVYRSHELYEFPEALSERLRTVVMDRCRCSLSATAASAEKSLPASAAAQLLPPR